MQTETNPIAPEEVAGAATNPEQAVVEDAVLLIGTVDDVQMEQKEHFGAEAETGTVLTVGAAEPEPTALDNALTLGLVGALALAVIALVIRRATRKPAPAPAVVQEAPVVDAPTAPGAAGEVKLHNVEPKTAAMLMAIVADKMQKPINELRFISIKEVE